MTIPLKEEGKEKGRFLDADAETALLDVGLEGFEWDDDESVALRGESVISISLRWCAILRYKKGWRIEI